MSRRADAPLPPLSALLPHRGRAVLLDRLVRHDGRETWCAVEIDGAAWLRRAGGEVPAWLGLEYMAQCIAAHEGCIAWREGRTLGPGYLARARRVRFGRSGHRAGEVLHVGARHLRGRPRLGAMAYACEIRGGAGDDAPLVAEAEITVALVPERAT